ncbi:MAG: alanine racemase, partial [Endomicrobia bacterium]|nr:alanine racemase [Endomicrobiia bacterium]
MNIKNFSLNNIFITRPTWIEINKNAVVSNITNVLDYLKKNKVSYNKVKLCAIVKSNAYGHGLKQIAKIVSQFKDVEMLGVTSVEEAVMIRELKIKKPILLLGSVYPFSNIKYIIEYNITPTVASIVVMKELNTVARKHNKKINFHLKIDTGMGRIGILPETVEKFIYEY